VKVFDLALGTVVILFGVMIGWFWWKTLDPDNLVINRKFVIGAVVTGAILVTGVRRILKKRPPSRS
jgi:hypothetical protein